MTLSRIVFFLTLAFIGGVFLLLIFGVVQYEFSEARGAPRIMEPIKKAFQNTLQQHIAHPQGTTL